MRFPSLPHQPVDYDFGYRHLTSRTARRVISCPQPQTTLRLPYAETLRSFQQYRLGPSGFLELSELGGDDDAPSANQAFWTSLPRLGWVHRNIAAFGADRNNVRRDGRAASVGALRGCDGTATITATSAWKEQGMERRKTSKALSGLERVMLVLGVLLLSFYVAARIHGLVFSRSDLNRFWQQHNSSTNDQRATSFGQNLEPNFQLWSPKRIAAYKITLEGEAPPPLAVLRIGAIDLEVPVLEGTDDFTLNRAVGHIDGTAEPGQQGSVAIAGHRDGFFRGLKDIHQGDAIELITRDKRIKYVVDETLIVSPEDVSVLAPRPKSSLTLVTCYPFYFVGSAPQRFIVHATIASAADRTQAEEQSLSAGKGGGQNNR